MINAVSALQDKRQTSLSTNQSHLRFRILGLYVADFFASIFIFAFIGDFSTLALLLFFTLWFALRFSRGLYTGYGFLTHVELKANVLTTVVPMVLVLCSVGLLPLGNINVSQFTASAAGLVAMSYFSRKLIRGALNRLGIYQKTFNIREDDQYAQPMMRFFERHKEIGFIPTLIRIDKVHLLPEALEDINTIPSIREMTVLSRMWHRDVIDDTLHHSGQPGGHTRITRWCLDFIKRVFDIVIALCALVLLSPVLFVIAVLIRKSGPGPIIYPSHRLGKNGKTFACYKFRTMYVDADLRLAELMQTDEALRLEYEIFHKLKNDPRITEIGQILRKTSLDELPQLLNILLGEMSLVGPRPYLESEQVKMKATAPLVFLVQPGLTGYWQVKGRSATTFEERLEMDRIYVHHWDLWWDFVIFLDTIKSVVLRKGAC